MELRPKDRWVSVPRDAHEVVSRHRHIVQRGKVTSACGTTALPGSTWRGNTTKPPCPTCVERRKIEEATDD